MHRWLFLPFLFLAWPAMAADAPRVLVLYSDERLLPANIVIDEAIRATFAVGATNSVEFHSEFFDAARFPGEAQSSGNAIFCGKNIEERRPDSVDRCQRCCGATFWRKTGRRCFPKCPIVYCSVAGDPRAEELQDERIASVPVFKGETPTLEMALRLHPGTRQVAVVAGSGRRDQQFVDSLREEIPAFENRVAFSWLTILSMEELRGALSRLPDAHGRALSHDVPRCRRRDVHPAAGTGPVRSR